MPENELGEMLEITLSLRYLNIAIRESKPSKWYAMNQSHIAFDYAHLMMPYYIEDLICNSHNLEIILDIWTVDSREIETRKAQALAKRALTRICWIHRQTATRWKFDKKMLVQM